MSVQSVQAQWVRVNGPYGFTVASLNAAGDNLFLSTSGDNYISADIGKSWRRLNSGISGQIKSVVGIGTNLFAGTKKGVFHSTDNGMTWDSASSGFPQFVPVNTLAVIGTKLFAGTGDVGGGGYAGNAYISNDYGKSWTLLHSWGSVNCLVAVGSTLFAGTGDFMYGMGAGEGGLFISRDNGVTWTDSGLHGIGTNNSVFFDGGYLFVHMTTYSSDHGYGSQLYISADSGKTWNNFNSSIMPLAAGPDGKGGMNLYGGSKGVFLSNNNGIDWTSIGLNNITVKSLAVIGTNLFAAFDKGIYYSYDFGGTWNLVNIKISALDIRFIAADSTNRLAVTTGNAIYLSTDGGASWDSTNSPQTQHCNVYSHLAFDGAALYALNSQGEFFVTSDNGNIWIKKVGNIDPNIGGDQRYLRKFICRG